MDNNYDVIIAGTGVAGLFTALHLPTDYKILMVTKASVEESDSFLAQGGICVLRDKDDFDSFYKDTLRAGHFENREESVFEMINRSRSIIEELVRYGVEFEMEDGEFKYTREGAHSRNRILYHEDVTGKEITSKLLKAVKALPNVEILEETTVVDILERNNTCDGVVVRTKDGIIRCVTAAFTMLATGGIGGIYDNSTNFVHLTGDAISIALRHNIKLENINYVQIHPTTLYTSKRERRFLISESVRGEGAILLNKNGERFVDELLPRDVVSAAIYKQMALDKTEHVWLSMATIKDMDIHERFPHICKRVEEEGLDPQKDLIPVVPSQHYFMGGVWVDLRSHTSMDNLYASGEAACNGVHGANRLASNSLLESLVFSRNAAEDMVRRYSGCNNTEKAGLSDYGLNEEMYADMNAFEEENKGLIWKEIDRLNEQREERKLS